MPHIASFNAQISSLHHLMQKTDDFQIFLQHIDTFQKESLNKLKYTGFSEIFAQAFILKIANFLVCKYQYMNHHEHMVGNPYGLIIDPANNCPLNCYGCLHNLTLNEKFGFDWPAGIMTEATFDRFIEKYGPCASTILFYNWGEPLLNKLTPCFIRKAKSFLLETQLSSNLSIHFDAEELVLSGLDYLIMSVDGITSESYGKYRSGGKFDLVVENIRRLVSAKKKFNSTTPKLSWQFLLFEHNRHEIDFAKKFAYELGVDEIRFAKSYEIRWKPELNLVQNIQEEQIALNNNHTGKFSSNIQKEISNLFTAKFSESWLNKISGLNKNLFRSRKGITCKWLYTSLVMDATGRYLPCCYAPRKSDSGFTYVFGSDSEVSPFNTPSYHFSRNHFVWPTEISNPESVAPCLPVGQAATYCVSCPSNSTSPLVNEKNLRGQLMSLDLNKILTGDSLNIITDWTVKI